MDTTLIAGLIGAVATILVAVLPPILARIRRDKGISQGTVDQLLIPLGKSHTREIIKDMLSNAKSVRICGWSLFRIMDENRFLLQELPKRGCDLRILILDPSSNTISTLDKVISSTDPEGRRSHNWPPVTPKNITQKDVLRTIDILRENDILGGLPSKTLRLCDSLLPYGVIMIEKKDGTCWLSVQIYPLHPDFRSAKRFSFTLANNKTDLWNTIQEQFDAAWDDPIFSHPYND